MIAYDFMCMLFLKEINPTTNRPEVVLRYRWEFKRVQPSLKGVDGIGFATFESCKFNGVKIL